MEKKINWYLQIFVDQFLHSFKMQQWLCWFWDELSWLEHSANNSNVVGLIPVQAVYLAAGLSGPCDAFQLRMLCDSVLNSV